MRRPSLHPLSLVLAIALLVAGCSEQPVSPELDLRLTSVDCQITDTCDPGGDGTNPDGPQAPTTTLLSAPDLLTTSTSATFTFSSNTTPRTFQCQLDGGPLVDCSSETITYNGLAAGTHIFSVFAVNGAGIPDASPAEHSWTVLPSADTEAPQTTITANPSTSTTSTSASFSFSGSDNVTAAESLTFECSLDGATFAACTSPATVAGLTLGSHTFQVRAIDQAGNIDASPASFTWTVTAVSCAAGSYLDGTTCVPAPAGSYVAGPGATSATQCAAGTFQPATGQTSCLLAPAGSFVSGPGATSATQCAAGAFQDVEGQTSCKSAPAGSFVAGPGATSATQCAVGTYQPATGQTSCLAAPAGSFVAGIGATSATQCAVGTYQPATGQTSCLVAPIGSYVDVAGATSATQCAVGTYQPATGQTSCIDAPIGSYVSTAGAASATSCPAGTTTLATGSTSPAACITQYTFTGFFAPVRNDVLNVVKAGRAVPISFSLGGDFGLDIFTAGHPASGRFVCEGGVAEDEIESTLTAGGSSLSYDPTTQRYTYVWKTEKTWTGTCRRLTLRFVDGTVRTVDFRFAR